MTRQPIPIRRTPPEPIPTPPLPPLIPDPSALWVDADEAGPILGTTAHTLRRLAREGRSPIVVRRIGGRWRFSRADLLRFIGDDAAGAAPGGHASGW